MKILLWLFALWLTTVTAAPLEARKFGGLGRLKAPPKAAPAPPKAAPAPSKAAPAPSKAAPVKSASADPASAKTSNTAASVKSTSSIASSVSASSVASSVLSSSVSASSSGSSVSGSSVISSVSASSSVLSSSVSSKSSSVSSRNSTSTVSSSSTSAINRAAWPTHPVKSGDIPTDQQLKAQKPIDTTNKLPALGDDYYAGPQVPANFSTDTQTNAQAVSEAANVQKPDNVGGAPLNVPQSQLGLRKRAKPGQATGEPAKVFFNGKGKPKQKCPKTFKDVVPFLNKPLQHEAMFYSAVDQFEYQFAEQKHLALVKPSLDPTYLLINDKCKNFWDLASQAWASVASGDVFVLLPDVNLSPIDAQKDKSSWPLPQWPKTRAGETSIWEKIEWPQLKANPDVCRVWRVGKTGNPLLLMVRTGLKCSYVKAAI